MANLEAFIMRCKRRGYCDRELPYLHDIFDDTDDNYFNSILKISRNFTPFY